MSSNFRVALAYMLFGLFVGYHLLIDRSYRLSADDFAVTDLATHGIPGISFALEMYLHWEGPFLGMTLLGLVCWLASVTAPWLPLVLVKGAMIVSTTVLFKAVDKRFSCGWAWADALGMAVVFNMVLYLISPDQSEIWHWLVGTPYLIPLIFIQLGAAALFNDKILWAIVPFAFVMQSRATYAVLIFGLLFLLALYHIAKNDRRKEWAIFISLTGFFLIIYLIAPGNYARMKEHGNSLAFMLSQFKVGLHNLFVSYNLAKMDRIALAVMGWSVFVGKETGRIVPDQKWKWAVPLLLYLSFAVAHELLFVLVTGYCEWTRVLSLHAFLFLTIMMVYGIWTLVRSGLLQLKWVSALSLFSMVALGLYMASGLPGELRKQADFVRQYDQRMELILSHKKTGDTLWLQPIEYNGKLYFEDFSTDPDHWINKDFRKAYQLGYKVAVKPSEK